MPFQFHLNKPVNVFLEKNSPSSLSLATNDLLSDLIKLFGSASLTDNEKEANIVIKINSSLPHPEEYSLVITKDKVFISGQNDLGAMWGIYSFLSEDLKVPPFYKIEGLTLPKRSEWIIPEKKENNYPEIRYRGWFINDEDLLSGFKTLGKREVQYEFYNDVIHPEMMDLLVETALRFRYNTIIPSTLIDITAPYERGLLDVCSKRGMYISQHHIEPLGLSKFGFNKYVREKGGSDAFSYVSNKKGMLEAWKCYVSLWSNYPRVIWQLGLRGGTDRPVWTTDKSVGSSNKERGELISSAINDQYNIIHSIYRGEVITTATLWMEGAELLKTGDIHLPNDTIPVLSDIGMSQLFGDDFFTIKREENRQYGVYYHAAYWHTGPHLSEGVFPSKMKYCYELMKNHRTNYYSMMNVANVKELTFSIYMNSCLSWNSGIPLEDIYHNYISLYSEDLTTQKLFYQAIKDYYSCLGDIGEEEYEMFCHKYDFSYHKYTNLPFPVVSLNDGMMRSYIFIPFGNKPPKCNDRKIALMDYGAEHMPQVTEEFKQVSNQLIPEYRLGFNEHWTYQTLYLNVLFKAGQEVLKAIDCYKKEYPGVEGLGVHYHKAQEELGKIFAIRKQYYTGEYANWFNDERKIGIPKLISILDEELEYATKHKNG